MSKRDYYETLGCGRDVDKGGLKKAYRRLAMKHHPDKGGDENKFKESVIDEFADAYLAGATPVPCIRCNERVKFRDLLETAKDLDADCMATGHYIQRFVENGKAELHKATVVDIASAGTAKE